MGAGGSAANADRLHGAVTVEAKKPSDGQDVATPRGKSAVAEVVRLRALLGECEEEGKLMKKAAFGDAPSLQQYFEFVFAKHDLDKDADLDTAEFWTLMDSLDINLAPKEIAALQRLTDADGSGSISKTEFLRCAPTFLKKAAMDAAAASGKAGGPGDASLVGDAGEAGETGEEAGASPPLSWLQLEDAEGNTFYYNKLDESTQWHAPEDFVKGVDGAASEEIAKLAPDMVSHLSAMFALADVDGSGKLETDEFKALLQKELNLDEARADQVVRKADSDENGVIRWQEFVTTLPKLLQDVQGGQSQADCWVQHEHEGAPYWINTLTGEAQWEDPGVQTAAGAQVTETQDEAAATTDADVATFETKPEGQGQGDGEGEVATDAGTVSKDEEGSNLDEEAEESKE